MKVLLDSSAWLAHLFGEPGVDKVSEFFTDPDTDVYISALSIPEVYGRLKAIGREAHWDEVWGMYSELFNSILAADYVSALKAIAIREAALKRLPTIDSLIAAVAYVNDMTLVHRDSHFIEIRDDLLRQIQLT